MIPVTHRREFYESNLSLDKYARRHARNRQCNRECWNWASRRGFYATDSVQKNRSFRLRKIGEKIHAEIGFAKFREYEVKRRKRDACGMCSGENPDTVKAIPRTLGSLNSISKAPGYVGKKIQYQWLTGPSLSILTTSGPRNRISTVRDITRWKI